MALFTFPISDQGGVYLPKNERYVHMQNSIQSIQLQTKIRFISFCFFLIHSPSTILAWTS